MSRKISIWKICICIRKRLSLDRLINILEASKNIGELRVVEVLRSVS
jgi:hypothetical protein